MDRYSHFKATLTCLTCVFAVSAYGQRVVENCLGIPRAVIEKEGIVCKNNAPKPRGTPPGDSGVKRLELGVPIPVPVPGRATFAEAIRRDGFFRWNLQDNQGQIAIATQGKFPFRHVSREGSNTPCRGSFRPYRASAHYYEGVDIRPGASGYKTRWYSKQENKTYVITWTDTEIHVWNALQAAAAHDCDAGSRVPSDVEANVTSTLLIPQERAQHIRVKVYVASPALEQQQGSFGSVTATLWDATANKQLQTRQLASPSTDTSRPTPALESFVTDQFSPERGVPADHQFRLDIAHRTAFTSQSLETAEQQGARIVIVISLETSRTNQQP